MPITDIISTAQAIIDVARSLIGTRSVVLIIENHTNLTLRRVADYHAHGGFAMPPGAQIPPRKADVFGSQSRGGSVGTGTEGSVTYEADGIRLTISWDNPYLGENSCNATLSGQNAGSYYISHVCGAGNTSAHMRYELFRR